MIVDREKIKTLKAGDIVWKGVEFKPPVKYTYVGVIGEYYIFTSVGREPIYIPIEENINQVLQLNGHFLCTTREEGLLKSRELSLDKINEFNRIHLKSNPIIVN